MVKLYEVPAGSKIRLIEETRVPPSAEKSEIGEVYKFFNIDGMYSYCQDMEGNLVHLAAWTEVEVVTDE